MRRALPAIAELLVYSAYDKHEKYENYNPAYHAHSGSMFSPRDAAMLNLVLTSDVGL